MGTAQPEGVFACSRRDFLKVAGLCAAGVGMTNLFWGCSAPAAEPPPTTNAGRTPLTQVGGNQFETDVLVIGGGLAAVFAAVKAREKGVSVLMVDKGSVGLSGASPWAGGYCVFDETEGHNRAEWIKNVSATGEYVNNRTWLEIFMEHSMARYQDLVAWGAADIAEFGPVLKKKAIESGVDIIERTMITDLLMQNGRVVGAMGFPMESDTAIIITAKATILCTGAGTFKSYGFPISCLTFDGDAMAYRVGAEITGKEFVDTHFTSAEHPAACWLQWGRMRHGLHKGGAPRWGGHGLDLGMELQAYEGQIPTQLGPPPGAQPGGGPPPGGPPPGGPPPGAPPPGGPPPGGPPGAGLGPVVGGASCGMGVHKAEGIWPIDTTGASCVPGLYAAGDALGTMQSGARYAGIGTSSSGSSVQGAIVGGYAADFAKHADKPGISTAEIDRIKTAIFAPRARGKGYSPGWITHTMQNTMFPYYVIYVKEKRRLDGALAHIEFLRDHIVPKMIANDPHDLRRAHEVTNMLLNAEMKLKASLFRTESRGCHFREDYPARNDDEWLAWIKIKQDGQGKMVLTKQEIPEEWKPDSRLSYEERYPFFRFPGELEFRQKMGWRA